MHGHIYIILKESIKYIPVLGTGMMFYGFIFLSRKWAKDKDRFQHRLKKLSTSHGGPLSGSQALDPMWLLIFPEGTGLLFCLQELEKTVDWVYDCTVAYEGVP
jgi:lysocardiolipin and lysophospholipid acyltransferase